MWRRANGDEPQGTMGRVQTAGTFSSRERRLGTRQLFTSTNIDTVVHCLQLAITTPEGGSRGYP